MRRWQSYRHPRRPGSRRAGGAHGERGRGRDALLGEQLGRLELPGHGAGFWEGLDRTLGGHDLRAATADPAATGSRGDCRDRALGARLRRLPVPGHQRGFWKALEATLGAQATGRPRGRRHVRPRIVAAASIAAAATLVATAWFGLPGATSGGLGRALAHGFLPPLQTTASTAGVSGNTLIWTSRRAADPATGVYDVNLFALDLATGRTRAVSTYPSWKRLAAVGGDKVAWIDGRGDAAALYLYDLPSRTTVRLATVGPTRAPAFADRAPGAASGVALSQNLIAWVDQRRGHGDLWVEDLSNGLLERVPGDGRRQGQPAVSDDVVAWVDVRQSATAIVPRQTPSGTDIAAYDVTAGRTFSVCDAPGDQLAPAISGPIVVWQDGRHRNGTTSDDWDIYGCDLRTGREFAVATGPGAQTHPAISGTIVLWTQQFTAAGRTYSMIMGRDLRSGRTFEVSDAGRYDYPSISGSTASWCTLGQGDTAVAVFAATVSSHDGRPHVEPLRP